uniref:Uncharacterized protein n=1 Tax=Chenopodium quinoa TaxID=63459 RepID=A0A803L751_CHEQI
MSKEGENNTFYIRIFSSVIPAKRKLVKRLIFDQFVSFFVSLCSSSHSTSVMRNSGGGGDGDGYGSSSNNNSSGEAGGSGNSNNKNNYQVYPTE